MKRLFISLFTVVLFAASLAAQNNNNQKNIKLDDSLNKKVKEDKDDKATGGKAKKGKEKVRVILKTIPSLNSAAVDEAKKHGAKELKKFNVLSGSVIEIPVEELDDLSKHPGIQGMSLDAPLKSSAVLASHLRVTSGVKDGYASYNAKGNGIGIAIIDSGIGNLPDLSNVVKSVNFTGDGLPPRSDPYGHGTHVAGLAAGKGISSGGRYRGIAPNASLVDLRVLKGDGSGNTSDVIAAVEWAIMNRNAIGDNGLPMNIRVINLSLGHAPLESAATDPLAAICREAVRQGIVVVAAAGNFGKTATGAPVWGGIVSPGTERAVLTVGAMTTWGTNVRTDDSLASYSSRGPTYIDHLAKPDIVAAGSGLIGPKNPGNKLIMDFPSLDIEGNYMKLSGTSMAAPVVAGAVALLLEKKPALTPNAVKAILMYTAEKRSQNTVMEVGAGYLNVSGALMMAMYINTSALQAPIGSTTMVQA
jgi:serine protease AprX